MEKGLLGPKGRSCGGKGGRSGSIVGRCGGWLAKCSIESNDGLGGSGLVVRRGGGEVKGGGFNLGVVNSLLGEIPKDVMGERGGDIIGVDGGAVW
ncbi:hypothetical protein Tco_0414776 [Tanacetum coccineum]